jgi:hypothetical protein
MKILHLPFNIASLPANNVRALNQINGIVARGLIFDKPHKFHDQTGLTYAPPFIGSKLNPLKWTNIARNYSAFANAVAWADIIHWYWDANCFPFNLDLKLIKWLKKPLLIMWVGSDIRHAEAELKDNPFYARVLENGYEYKEQERREGSLIRQHSFSKAGAYPIVCVEMLPYIEASLFPTVFTTHQGLDLRQYIAKYPNPENKVPLIVHTPTAPVAKGTRYVLEAIEQLKKEYTFDFRLIQNMERSKAIQSIMDCDIMLDQFILGAHGMAATEAMAYGKPVLCYIKPATQMLYPPDLPLINASPDDLVEKLEPLLRDGALRHEAGRKSRAYAEKYHDANQVAKDLVKVYREVISRAKEGLCR